MPRGCGIHTKLRTQEFLEQAKNARGKTSLGILVFSLYLVLAIKHPHLTKSMD
jgi:hypothetical protein